MISYDFSFHKHENNQGVNIIKNDETIYCALPPVSDLRTTGAVTKPRKSRDFEIGLPLPNHENPGILRSFVACSCPPFKSKANP